MYYLCHRVNSTLKFLGMHPISSATFVNFCTWCFQIHLQKISNNPINVNTNFLSENNLSNPPTNCYNHNQVNLTMFWLLSKSLKNAIKLSCQSRLSKNMTKSKSLRTAPLKGERALLRCSE